jgi:hypothetical protein
MHLRRSRTDRPTTAKENLQQGFCIAHEAMKRMHDDEADLLVAKVGLVESFMVGVLAEMASRKKNPANYIEALAANIRKMMEGKIAKHPKGKENEIASVVALEVFDTFMDRVRVALK